jgi:hypothetical protein
MFTWNSIIDDIGRKWVVEGVKGGKKGHPCGVPYAVRKLMQKPVQ